MREVVNAGVRDLDAEDRIAGQEHEAEIASGEPHRVAAFAASSATRCSAASATRWGRSRSRIQSVARSRARRAPRGVGDRSTLKWWAGERSWVDFSLFT